HRIAGQSQYGRAVDRGMGEPPGHDPSAVHSLEQLRVRRHGLKMKSRIRIAGGAVQVVGEDPRSRVNLNAGGQIEITDPEPAFTQGNLAEDTSILLEDFFFGDVAVRGNKANE